MINDIFELIWHVLILVSFAAFVAFCLWLPWLLIREFIRSLPAQRKKRRSWYCQICGYNLKANTTGICSECGTSTRKLN